MINLLRYRKHIHISLSSNEYKIEIDTSLVLYSLVYSMGKSLAKLHNQFQPNFNLLSCSNEWDKLHYAINRLAKIARERITMVAIN